MPSRFTPYKKVFPFWDALKIYKHIKKKKSGFVHFSFLKHPVYLRGISSDEIMFGQLFVSKDYAVDYPFVPKTILDLGANVGYASIFFSNKFPDAKIVALEPEKANYFIAKKNLDPYTNVQLLQGAVWYKETTINVVDKGFGEAAFMIEEGKPLDSNAVTAYTIPQLIRMLDVEYIDLIKMDIEGTEKELFENNYDEWLPKTKMIIVETHDRYKKGCSTALFQAFSKYNFSLELSGENLVLYNNNLINHAQ